MARIVWSRGARNDLNEITSFIRAASPGYSKSFALRIQRRVAQLADFPDSGRLVPEDQTGTYRELIIGDYRIVYRHDEDIVRIAAVIHGARSLERGG